MKIKRLLIGIILLGCSFCQLLLTTYFNIFEGKEHMGIDASWNYLKVIVAAKEGGIFPKAYMSETTQPECERIFLAKPLYLLTNDVFLSYGVSTLIITIVCIFILWKIADNYNLDFIQRMIVVNMFLCPYLANGYNIQNELGYHEAINGFSAFYNVLILCILLVIWFVTAELDNKKIRVYGSVIGICLTYICVCKGLGILIWLGLPIILYILLQVVINNDCKLAIEGKNIFLLLFIVAMLCGRIIGGLFGLNYKDAAMNWVNASEYFKNIGNILTGFWLALGGLPDEGVERTVTSFTGGVYCFGIIISLVFTVSVVYWTVKTIAQLKEKNINDILFLILIIISNIVAFSFLKPYAIAGTFSVRYLIPALLAGFVLTGCFIKECSYEYIYTRIGTSVLFISIVFMSLYSYYFLGITDNTKLKTDELLAEIDKTDAGIVYFWDNEKTLMETERIIRVIDPSRVYKSISYGNKLENFGDYSYYDNSEEYKGASIIVLLNEDEKEFGNLVADYKRVAEVDKYVVYYCDYNPIDLKHNVKYLF